MMKQINSFLLTLRTIYSQQGQIGKILLPGVLVLLFCCLCSALVAVFRPRNSPAAVPSPMIFPTLGNVVTPTALFSFGSPFPTLIVPTALPTTPSPATLTPAPTQTTVPTATSTLTLSPTVTAIAPTATNFVSVLIVGVDKPREYVDIQNFGNGPVDLTGWRLVSVMGNQSCALSGVLQPTEILRIWAGKGNTGLSCRFPVNIWNDNTDDPAVLYNAQGQEVSRYP
jgi:hypothetical protein